MPAISTVPLSGDIDLDGVLSRVEWAVTRLTYSFPTSASFYGSRYGSGEQLNNFEVLNATQKAAARDALRAYQSVANLTFTEITETSSTHADLRYAQSDLPDTAWAYYPATPSYGGDSWYNNSSGWYDSPIKGTYAYHTFLHETGHALGLKHGQEYPAVSPRHDSMEYTVMTYHSYVGQTGEDGYTNGAWSYAQSLMMYDIAAVQYMYGANYSTNSGDTTYRWSASTGEMSIDGVGHGAPIGNRVFMTVWDGGGIDTYDFSSYTAGVAVNLEPGAWSTLSQGQLAYLGDGHYAEGNVANALLFDGNVGSLIENANGGSGDDTLIGNTAANRLAGNAGNDVLMWTGGVDRLDGGADTDSADFSRAAAAVMVSVRDAVAYTSDGGTVDTSSLRSIATLAAIEAVTGTAFDDVLGGDAGANRLAGGAGNDELYGEGGNDVLAWSAGVDHLNGGADTDTADFSGAGAAVMVSVRDGIAYTSDGPTVVATSVRPIAVVAQIEAVTGTGFDDVLGGDAGANRLEGGAGDDELYGEGCNDELYGQGGNDVLAETAGVDRLDGGGGADTADLSST